MDLSETNIYSVQLPLPCVSLQQHLSLDSVILKVINDYSHLIMFKKCFLPKAHMCVHTRAQTHRCAHMENFTAV